MSNAFALLVLDNAQLTQAGHTDIGRLALECVTVAHPDSLSANDRDVYLVLRLNATETPLDPERAVVRIDRPDLRTYRFHGTQLDPIELNLAFPLNPSNPLGYTEDLDTFESILMTTSEKSLGSVKIGGVAKGDKDFRGQLVMMDEKTGEIVGQVEDRFRIREDPVMHTRGHEDDAVVIEVAEETDAESDANALQAFARIVPPDEQNWITKGATVVSQAISITTNLVVTTISSASNYYINHASPSPHHSGASTPITKDGSPPALPPRPRALVFLTSESTRKNLGKVHAVTGEAVKVSGKTVKFIDGMIRRAIGSKPKRERGAWLRPQAQGPNPVSPSNSQSSSASGSLSPPPYSSVGGTALPPRRSSSPAVPPPLPPRERLSTKDKVLISADLILSTIDHSTRQLLDVGTDTAGKVVHHKYGQEAAESTVLMANSARNVGLVYVDMRGIGRRALLKRAGKVYVKSKLASKDKEADLQQVAPTTKQ
ncbi:hypothetical protein FA15DRAFT_378241 [Coprinopsis marcescibilis]|uniref:Senescence domain-containing protein n=1 Tax=Coprinopsis marcescibilis TaxID=230819 RepID=A0A5C3KXC8_COPMA|nr:hypothetical protein FA15DRAFT_378241 [Coprinopsis marcescibilis]